MGPAQENDLDAAAGRAAAELLQRSHLLPPGNVAGALAEAGRVLGIEAAQVYLADLQQRHLQPMPDSPGAGPGAGVLAIESTLAGRAYRTFSICRSPADAGRHRVWIPLIDGSERLGVLELVVRDASEAMLARYRMLASLAGLMLAGKSGYSDTYVRTHRSRPMAVQAELVWAFLAPRTFATDRVLVAATLEPAYEVGGDAYDYALVGDRLHVAIFDSVGHDLAAGLLASVGIAACRSTRRAGRALPDIAAQADRAIATHFGDSRFVTALLCDLDLTTGLLSWIPCGHPPPLLIRGNKVVKELARRPQLPLGLAELDWPAHGNERGGGHRGEPAGGSATPPAPVFTERLEPGDRVLLYTDGVTEGRAADGTPFGVERLSDFIIRHSDDGTPAPETLRRLNHAIVDYQAGRLADDATIVLLEWMPGQPERTILP